MRDLKEILRELGLIAGCTATVFVGLLAIWAVGCLFVKAATAVQNWILP